MFARVSTIEGKPEQLDKGILNFREEMLPSARKTAGFKGAFLLVDRKSGKSVGITLWSTEQDMQNSANSADKLRSNAAKATGASKPPKVEIYEVAAQS